MNASERIERGASLAGKFRFAEAEKEFRAALQLDPVSLDARTRLARLLILKNTEESLRLSDEVLTREPSHAEALAVKGICFFTQGKYPEAIECLQKARSIKPQPGMIDGVLARALRKTGDLNGAEEAARKAIQSDPHNYEAFSELSFVLVQKGRVQEGILKMLEAVRINPLFAKGYLILAELYHRAKQEALAIRICREGLKHSPDVIPLHELLMTLLAGQGDFKGAYVEGVETAIRRQSGKDYILLGDLAVRLNDHEHALLAYQRALSVEPLNRIANERLAHFQKGGDPGT
jgi:tetratricopeptide (TPR) repeat protein